MAEFGQDERRKVGEFLTKKWVGAGCRACRKNSWIVEGYVNIQLAPSQETFVLGGNGIPAVVVVCKNCGLIEHVSTKVMGL